MSIINKMLNDLGERGVSTGQPLTDPLAELQNTLEPEPSSSTSSARRRLFYITLGIIVIGLTGLLVEQEISNKLPGNFAALFNNFNKTEPPPIATVPASTAPLASPNTNTIASATNKPMKIADATHRTKEQQAAESIRLAKEQQAIEAVRLTEEKQAAETARLAKKQQAAEAAQLAKEQKAAEAARLAKEKQETEAVRLAKKKQDTKAEKLAKTKQATGNKQALAEQATAKKTSQAQPASSQTATPMAQSLNGALNQDTSQPRTQPYVLLPDAEEVSGTPTTPANPLPPIASGPAANRVAATTEISSTHPPVATQAEQVKPPITTTALPSTTSLPEVTAKPTGHGDVSNQLQALVASGDKAGAIKLLGALQSQDPANVTWAVEKSRLELQLGQATTALASLQKTLPKIRPTANYYALLGGTAHTAKAYTQTNDYYLNAIRLEPREGRWYLGLGRALQAQGKTETAISAYNQALASGSLSPELTNFAHLQINQMGK